MASEWSCADWSAIRADRLRTGVVLVVVVMIDSTAGELETLGRVARLVVEVRTLTAYATPAKA